eukprot:scaffold672443_cov46-Prasinocladus_malaysianus.AAC.1
MNATQLSSRASVASTEGLARSSRSIRTTSVLRSAAPLRVDCAITRAKKEEIVGKIRGRLDESMLLFGMRYSDMPVKQLEKIRKSLPRETTVFVAKNSLMRIATGTEEYSKWSVIEQCTSRDNVWFMVPEENIADTVKALNKVSGATNTLVAIHSLS